MSEEQKVLPAPSEKPSSSKSGFLILLLLIVALGGGAGYGGFWLWQQSQSYASELENSSDTIQAQNSKIEALELKLVALQQALNDAQTTLSQNREITESSLQALANEFELIKGSSRKDWLLAEAEYLLRIANQRLMIERDITSSQSLLTAADKVLAEVADPALMPVRMKIAEDVFALQASTDSQVEQHAIALTALSSSAANLQLRNDARLTDEPLEPSTSLNTEPQTTFERVMVKFKDAFSRAIRIERADEKFAAPPTPEYSAYLIQNLGLRIEQARLFLLRGQYNEYQGQLQSTREWMQEFFPSNNHHVTVIESQLAKLEARLPQKHDLDISRSLTLLQEIIERKYRSGELQKHSSAEDKALENDQ